MKEIKKNSEPSTYKNELASLKRFYRDYLGMADVVSSFKFPSRSFKPIIVPSKEELQRFYAALKTLRDSITYHRPLHESRRVSEERVEYLEILVSHI